VTIQFPSVTVDYQESITNLRSASSIVAFGTSFDLPSSSTRATWLLMWGSVLPPPSVDKQSQQSQFVAQQHYHLQPDHQWWSSSFQESNSVRIAWPLTFDLDLEHTLDAGLPGNHRVQVWWRSGHLPARRSDLRKSLQTDRRWTPRHCISSFLEWAKNESVIVLHLYSNTTLQ